ncbi:MAG: rod shape-determining protein MreC [Tannerella sp.]|jgi:rod shape-determining protein MreC|nr:rod shape-determining protein MreC [Tannerella sp.]
MQKLLEFLFSKRHWLVFILCEVISFVLLYRYNAYQRNIFLGSAHTAIGYVSSVSATVLSYIQLREENKLLNERNGLLELEVLDLEQQLETLRSEQLSYDEALPDSLMRQYQYISARVVNNSVSRLSNYITINKGAKDGIQPDMGVVSTRGVVGIVSTVDEHFSVVISLLNPKSKLSCKLKGRDYYGMLSWDGRDTQYAHLGELPNHVEFQKGDTVVTSGFSAIFPPGIRVGTIVEMDNSHSQSFYSLKVKLATDFQRLKNIRVIRNLLQQERLTVEREARKND